jgi:osmotically-inducible protein OsmY
MQLKHTPTQETLMSKDSKLQKAVLAELAWEPRVTAAHVGVTAEDGVVTLSGHVSSFVERHAAEAAARRVSGVKAVVEGMEVRLAFDGGRGDDDIAAAAIERLAWDASIPPDAVKVSVENGWVTLSGVVEWFFEKEAAEIAVRPLRGIVGLTNHIALQARANAATISDDILHALGRSWFFDPKTVEVTDKDGKVRLSGTVPTPHARQVAAETAWASPGTVEVQNDIRVV